jgi:hypothetical protein
MDCCWETHGILTFTVDTTDMNLFEDHRNTPLAMATEVARLDITAKAFAKCREQSTFTSVSLNPL